MTAEFAKLIEILVKQRDVFLKLKETMAAGEQALRRYDASSVDEYNKSVEVLKLRLDALEQARLNYMKIIAQKLNVDDESINLSDLISVAPEKFGAALMELQIQLRQLAEAVSGQNKKNHILARASLEIVHDLGQLIGQVAGENVTYKPFNSPRKERTSAGVISRRL